MQKNKKCKKLDIKLREAVYTYLPHNSMSKHGYKGITLIALVITIIVLLILAGVTIATLTVENGILTKAKKSVEVTEIEQEKEIVMEAYLSAQITDVTKVLKETLQKCLDEIAGKDKTELNNDGDNFIVHFKESNRYYQIDQEGNLETYTIYEDSTPGELEGIGTEEEPFKIESIEDLVAFSIMTNGGNKELGINSKSFSGEYVTLERTLDFESNFSYNDFTTEKYGDLNKDGTVENIKTELTKKDEEKGCIGFTRISRFDGTFDGKGNELKNIYMYSNQKTSLALFAYIKTLKNLNLSGEIISKQDFAAGFSQYGTLIENCKNYADVTGFNMVGGICSLSRNNITIDNCMNYGTITITGYSYGYSGAGGIIGCVTDNPQRIEDCVNEGSIIGTSVGVGGIIGCSRGPNIETIGCLNHGYIQGGGGIVGRHQLGVLNIINCYNLGECDSGIVKYSGGAAWDSILELNIKNSYNLGKVTNAGIIGSQGVTCAEIALNIDNCYNAGESDKAIIGKIETSSRTVTTTNIYNTYYEISKSNSVGVKEEGVTKLDEIKNNSTFIETLNNNIGDNTEWKHWKTGTDGYPTFQ